MKRTKEFRIEQKERVVKSRKKLLKDTKISIKQKSDNYLSKQHPLGCSNSECLLCHSSKILDEKTVAEKKVIDSFKQQIDEE